MKITSEETGLQEWASRLGIPTKGQDRSTILRAIFRKKYGRAVGGMTDEKLLASIAGFEGVGNVRGTTEQLYPKIAQKMAGQQKRSVNSTTALNQIARLD